MTERGAAPARPASSAGLPGGLGAPPYGHYDPCAGSLLDHRSRLLRAASAARGQCGGLRAVSRKRRGEAPQGAPARVMGRRSRKGPARPQGGPRGAAFRTGAWRRFTPSAFSGWAGMTAAGCRKPRRDGARLHDNGADDEHDLRGTRAIPPTRSGGGWHARRRSRARVGWGSMRAAPHPGSLGFASARPPSPKPGRDKRARGKARQAHATASVAARSCAAIVRPPSTKREFSCPT